MALYQKAGWLILASALAVHAAEFPARHAHWRKVCAGTMTVDGAGVRFSGAASHAWSWKLEDIQQLVLAPDSIRIVTYESGRLPLEADRTYTFTGHIPAAELDAFLAPRMDRRLVLELAQPVGDVAWSVPVKHLGRNGGSQGALAFGAEGVAYRTLTRDQSRTWRYTDIRTLSSADAFELTIATREKDFHFQLKQPIDEARYNQLWLRIEQQNRRIEP
ncbi:MAG: hypothetical protein ACLPX8_13485 [Bryobacteraceae bacterium]|jgi:hypothetical protein